MSVELQPLVLESTLTMQKILEAQSHSSRLKLVRHFVEAETKRLNTKKTLKGMFSGSTEMSVPTDAAIPAEERISDTVDTEAREDSPAQTSSLFTDEPDAFQ